METNHRSALRQHLQAQAAAIAAAWYRAVLPTGFSHLAAMELQQQFRTLTDATITSILADPFAPTAGELVGRSLAQLGFGAPESLRASLAVLPEQLLGTLDAASISLLLPRLHAFQAAFAAGLCTTARQQADAAYEQNQAALVAAHAAAQAQRQVAEERLRAVIAHVPLVLFATDQQGVITFVMGRGLAALGIRAPQLVGHTVEAVGSQQPAGIAAVHAALRGETTTLLVTADARRFEARYAPLFDDSGAISGMIGVALDVTEHTQQLPVDLPPDLTPDDQALLTMLAEGQSNRQIGAMLGISDMRPKNWSSSNVRDPAILTGSRPRLP